MTTPRDMLPQWLVHHDRLPAARTSSSSAAVSDPAINDVAALEKSSSSLSPPSHITMVPWDDGFTPSGCNNKPGKMIRDQVRSMPGAFRVIDCAVSRETADLLYMSAVKATVWGVYVPTTELSFSNQSTNPSDSDNKTTSTEPRSEGEGEESYRRSLARRAVQELLVTKASDVISPSDWRNTHGVAVWVIASGCDDETEYHLDYAEMVRYETNVIVPPLYGATLHVSALRNLVEGDSHETNTEDDDRVFGFEGGGFHVNVNGLEHYRQYGYKTRLAHKLSTDALEAVSTTEPGWQHVPYLYRRGILCDGEFPHFSGRVRSLPSAAAATTTPEQLPVKRVVVGFNLFPPEIGAFVEKFPEHSNAFNKYIKVSQAAVKQAGGQQPQAWSLASLKANPKQAAFLKFLAKKIKEKNVDISTLTKRNTGENLVNAPVETAPAS